MKKLILIISTAALCSCSTFQQAGSRIKEIWERPSTQEVVVSIREVALSFAFNLGMAAVQQYADTGKVNLSGTALTAGANTLWQQASALRQIQGTRVVVDPIAVSSVLQSNGTSEEMARAIAAVIAYNARDLLKAGVDPDQASEIQASEFDRAAAMISGIQPSN